MRLQLTVQRQGLPPVHVLWTVGGFRPGYSTNEASTTISQLLDQINEIIPLEAEEWGLEDYVVEVRGFECLHFSGLDKILKEDDEVTIRPLQTSDLRYRKMSGRHQISTDGRHLIDGVSFGRPFLRRADRPSIRIPPRKRIRLMNEEEEEEDVDTHMRVPETNRQTFIRTSPDLGKLDDSSGDDEEFALHAECDESLDAELGDLRDELANGVNGDGLQLLEEAERTVHLDGTASISGRLTRSRRRRKQQGLGLQGEDILELVDENGRQYPGEYHNPLLEQYYQDQPESQVERGSMDLRVKKSRPKGASGSTQRLLIPEQISRRSSSASMKSVRFQEDVIKTPVTVLEADDDGASDDENFELNESIESTSSESNKENVKPGDQARDSSNASSDPEQPSSIVSFTSESGGSETSSSLALSSTSSSDSESPESSSISIRDSRLNTEDAGQTPGARSAPKNTPSNAQHSPTHRPPGLGRRDTQKRNQRRRESKRLQHLKRIGILPSNATKSDLLKQTPRSKLSGPDMPEAPQSNDIRLDSVISERRPEWGETATSQTLEASNEKELNTNAEFEARRQLLLDSIASGGVEVEPSTELDCANMKADSQDREFLEVVQPDTEISTTSVVERSLANTAATPVDQSDVTQASEIFDIETDQPKAVDNSYPSATATGSQPLRRRAKLDIASSRRLLFGSLGLRTPKSKDDEDKMREKLKEKTKPVLQSLNDSTEPMVANPKTDSADGDDTWKNKIVLKAVECCDDGIELSTPPFPFVQRWDPQQQGRLDSTNGGYGMSRGKKRKRNKSWAHDDNITHYEDYEDPVEQQEQDFGNDKTDSKGVGRDQEQAMNRTPSDEYQGAVDEQLMRDAHDLSAVPVIESVPVDNLSSILPDPSSCLTLLKDLAVPGTIIAFKQLEMSQETSWQPQVSTYRTALIDRVSEEHRFEMTLAQQDRPSTKARLYDENTGKRIYSKFEVPDDESEDMQDEDGIIELSFEEMIEPKLIKPAKDSHEQPSRQAFQPLIEIVDLSNTIDADEKSQSPIDNVREEDAEAREHPVIDAGGNLLYQEMNETVLDQISQRGGYVEVTEETRKEISILIKDAGFRSDVHSDIDRELENHGSADMSNEQPARDDSYPTLSPRFNGFSSSPPAEQVSNLIANALSSTHDTPSILQQDEFELPEIPSPIQLQSRQEVEAGSVSGQDLFTSLYEDNEIRNGYSSDPPKHFNFDQTILPERLFSHPSPPLKNPEAASKVSKTQPAHVPARIGGLDGADSDSIDELLTTENLSSTGRPCMEVALSDNDDDDFPVISSQRARVKKSKLSGSQSKPQLQSQSQSQLQSQLQSQSKGTKRSFSIADVLASSTDGDSDFETMSTPRASQIPVGSQIVDLTLSSDAVDPEDSEYEDRGVTTGLPAGPGWVKKTRNGRRSEAARVRDGRIGGGRKTRSM